jgi:hypothetical protein
MNTDPDTIRLEGEELKFWRTHADFLNSLADLSEEPDVLVLKRDERPFLGNDIHFNFFWDIVHGVPVAHYKQKNGSFKLKTEKGYTLPQIREFLEYIGYDKYEAGGRNRRTYSDNQIRRFKANVLEHLNTNMGEEPGSLGHGTGKPRKQTRKRRYYVRYPNGNRNLNRPFLIHGGKQRKTRRQVR